MQHSRVPSIPDLIFVVVAPLTAILGGVKLTQSDGDLAAHIRMGNQILQTSRIPSHSLASYTATIEPMIAHSWLSEVFFASLFRAGGLPLICVVVGMIIGLTHGLIALFLRSRGADPRWVLMASLLSLAIASIHWLARPHIFSILGSAVTVWVLESTHPRRQLYFLPIFALWANLHGGWAYGLAIIVMYVVGDLAEAWLSSDRSFWMTRARRDATSLGLAVAGTVVNPYGLGLHREVLAAITSSTLARNMSEFMPANFQDWTQAPFLLALLLTIALVSLSVRRIPLPWLSVILMSVFLALRSSRNIALFAVTGWPLLALHAANSFPSARRFSFFKEFARLDSNARVGWPAASVTALLLLLGLNHGAAGNVQLIADHFDTNMLPVTAVDRARQAHLSGRVFGAWRWSGYIMYAWPEASLHVDPLKFSDRTIESYGTIEDLQPGWVAELARWQVQTVIVGVRSPLARQLNTAPGWRLWYRDSTAVVFRASSGNTL